MRRLNRYIGATIFGSVSAALFVLLSLDMISAVVEQVGELKGDYTFFEALKYVALTVPSRIYEWIPLSALVGCLFGLGSLASSSELVVMRSAGVSVARISWFVTKPVLMFIIAGVLLGEYVTPVTDQLAESRRALAQGEKKALQSRRGLWSREGNEFMHFNAVLPNGVLYGITRYHFDQQGRLLSSSFIERATYQGATESRDSYWLEEQGQITEFSGGSDEVRRWQFSTRRWLTQISPGLLNVLVLSPDALSIRSLYSYASYLVDQGWESDEYWLAFWQKVLRPLAVLSLVLIGISFIFGPLRQVTMGFRIFTGIVIGSAFDICQGLLGPSSLVFGFSPLLAVLIPIVACLVVGTSMLRNR